MKKVYILDAVKIIFQNDPAAAGLFFILRLLQALTPILQTLAVAAFVDRVSEAAGILGTDTAAGRMRTGGMRAAGSDFPGQPECGRAGARGIRKPAAAAGTDREDHGDPGDPVHTGLVAFLSPPCRFHPLLPAVRKKRKGGL